MKKSNKYIPGISSSLYFRNLSERIEEMKDIQPVDAIIEKDTFLRVGIANTKDRNKQYKDLVFDLQIEVVDNTTIIEEIQQGLLDSSQYKILSTSPKNRYSKMIQEYDRRTKEFVIEMHQNGWSHRKLKAILSINEVCLRSIINEDKFHKLQMLKRIN